MGKNVFTDVMGGRDAAIRLLQDAIEAIENGSIKVEDITMETPPGAFDRGLTSQKSYCFFGFSYSKGTQRKHPSINTAVQPQSVDNVKINQNNVDTRVYPKMSESRAMGQHLGKDGMFACNCCEFKTKSIMGFKKHWNKCIRKKDLHNIR